MKKTTKIVGVPACVREVENRSFHGVGERYLDATFQGINAIPMIIPAMGLKYNNVNYTDAYLDKVDGLFLTGSFSMVCPTIYGEKLASDDYLLDPKRDATTFPLIKRALQRGIPLLCICRGIQELNVALGGTLYQDVNNLSDMPTIGINHYDKGFLVPEEVRFGVAHTVELVKGGLLEKISPVGNQFWVNSLHTQAIRTLGEGLAVEAISSDGIVEAVSVKNASNFAIGIQWHPEWRVAEHPFSKALFQNFSDAM